MTTTTEAPTVTAPTKREGGRFSKWPVYLSVWVIVTLWIIPALGLFILLGWILKRLFVEEGTSSDGPSGQQQGSLTGEGGA